MRVLRLRFTVPVIILIFAAGCADCDGTGPDERSPIFAEDFEQGLDQWVGRPVTGHHAQIVQDPLNPDNSVVNFFRTVAAGDLFTHPIEVNRNRAYRLIFDYLGLPTEGSQPRNLGGFLGIADGMPGSHFWLYGPAANPAAHQQDLLEDGQWHSYSVTFYPSDLIEAPEDVLRIMIEDGEGALSVAGDAYFDNIQLIEADR